MEEDQVFLKRKIHVQEQIFIKQKHYFKFLLKQVYQSIILHNFYNLKSIQDQIRIKFAVNAV